MRLTSDALKDGQIPVRYSKDGNNASPPLAWSDLPSETKELALLFENITPQTQEPFVQWLVYGIPADVDGLPEGYQHKRAPKEPLDVLQGRIPSRTSATTARSAPSAGRSATASGCSRWMRRSTCRPGSQRKSSSRRAPATCSKRAI